MTDKAERRQKKGGCGQKTETGGLWRCVVKAEVRGFPPCGATMPIWVGPKDLYYQSTGWRSFIEGPLYGDTEAPWREDPAFLLIARLSGLRASVGGRAERALRQAIGLVRALTGVDVVEVVTAKRPAEGLCLGFGENVLEPYDLLRVFGLDRVHAYEWVGKQVVEAAQALEVFCAQDPLLPSRIRLHQGTLSDLSALSDTTIRVVYAANVFNYEVPMSPKTFSRAVKEILRVLAEGGLVLSRGSSGLLEEELSRFGRMLLQTPLVSVFQK